MEGWAMRTKVACPLCKKVLQGDVIGGVVEVTNFSMRYAVRLIKCSYCQNNMIVADSGVSDEVLVWRATREMYAGTEEQICSALRFGVRALFENRSTQEHDKCPQKSSEPQSQIVCDECGHVTCQELDNCINFTYLNGEYEAGVVKCNNCFVYLLVVGEVNLNLYRTFPTDSEINDGTPQFRKKMIRVAALTLIRSGLCDFEERDDSPMQTENWFPSDVRQAVDEMLFRLKGGDEATGV